MTASLTGARLRLVENQAVMAMRLEAMLTDLGCVLFDIAAPLSRGLALVESAAGARDATVLDVNLGGVKVHPVAERLAAGGALGGPGDTGGVC